MLQQYTYYYSFLLFNKKKNTIYGLPFKKNIHLFQIIFFEIRNKYFDRKN